MTEENALIAVRLPVTTEFLNDVAVSLEPFLVQRVIELAQAKVRYSVVNARPSRAEVEEMFCVWPPARRDVRQRCYPIIAYVRVWFAT